MKLLRGLGGLGTTALVLLITNVSGLYAEDPVIQDDADRNINESVLLQNLAETHNQTSNTMSEQTVQQAPTQEAKTRKAKALDKALDIETITLTGALVNLALDLFDHKNAFDYIKEKFTAIYHALLERLPGFMEKPTAQNAQIVVADAINDTMENTTT